VILLVSIAICLAADRLAFMSVFVALVLAARLCLLYGLRRREQINFRAELLFLGICTLVGAYNDWTSVCVKGVYAYTVPHAFDWSSIPLWMLLYWGMILRMFARVARWRALKPPAEPSNLVVLGRRQMRHPALKLGFMFVLVFITRRQIYQHYLHPTWSWLPFLVALLVFLCVCRPDRHDLKLMAIVLPVGPLVEAAYINLGGLHYYHLGIVAGVPLWIILWWLLIILIWKDIALRLEIALRRAV